MSLRYRPIWGSRVRAEATICFGKALYTETGWDVAREYWHLYPNVIAEALTEPEPTEIRLQVQEKTPISAAEDDKKYIDKQKSNR